MIGFERLRTFNELFSARLIGMSGELNAQQSERFRKIKRYWNFYEGFHWEELPDTDGTELTLNYCKTFVDKFTAFELGEGFKINPHKDISGVAVTPDGRTVFDYLQDVWEDNQLPLLVTDIGQMKSVTGESWVQVRFTPPEEVDDPYNEYPEGRIELLLMPTSVVFPEFDPHHKGIVVKLSIMYMYEKIQQINIFGKTEKKQVMYKQTWTKDQCVIKDGDEQEEAYPNKYQTIPFVQIKNLSLATRNEGRGDIEDIVPMNIEYNQKSSNVSDIIDYHAAPVTLVFGAKIGNIEKGMNKLWGGLPKDSKVQNLEMQGDLGASSNYIQETKRAMCEVAGVPETCLGGAQAISNTSGVALQYMNLPLIEKTKLKRMNSKDGFERLNKLILLVSLCEALIIKPEDVPNRVFFKTEVTIPDTLPKDKLLELQQIQIEMALGLEDRRGAMLRLGNEDVDEKLKEIDEDRKVHPELYSQPTKGGSMNSGVTNGETPVEQVRKEITGQNGGGEVQ